MNYETEAKIHLFRLNLVCYRASISRNIFPTFKLENNMGNHSRKNEANKTLI